MKVLKKFLILVLIIAVLAQGAAIYYLYNIGKENANKVNDFETSKLEKLNFIDNIIETEFTEERDQILAVEKEPKSVEDLFVTGWIPDWDYNDGVDTLVNRSDVFDGVSPFWYELESDGSLKETLPAKDQTLINYAKSNNIELIPTVTSFNAEKISGMLSSEENINRHIDSIVSEVVNNNYDGIDLDYESINRVNREKFFDFMSRLAKKLYENDKKFVFTVLPKWGDDVVYLYFPETRSVQDYKRIADIVDEFRIMTYEYGSRDNKYVQPVAPLEWMEDTLRYAIKEGVPRDKIVLGIPTYSYDYTSRPIAETLSYYPVMKHSADESKKPAAAYYNNTVDDIINAYSPEVNFNETWGEAILKYRYNNREEGTQEDRIVIFPTSKSIELRKKLAADYGLKGIAIWRIGDEGSLEY